MEKELCIVVVDDDAITRAIIVKMLNKKSFIDPNLDIVTCKVKAVESGKKVLEMLEKENIDIIVCDIEMPEMDGLELCQIIRKSKEKCNLPFIFLSTHTDIEVRLEALNIGGNDYLSKPFSIEELLIRIKKIILTNSAMSANKNPYNPLEQTSLKQLIELILKHQLSGNLNIDFKNCSEASISFENGKITKVIFDQLQGEQALKKILSIHHIAHSFEGDKPSDLGIVSSNIIQCIKL